MADRIEIHSAIEKAVGEWLGSGTNGPISLTSDARPVGGVSGFDSYSGIVATVQLGVELGIDLTTDNIFLTSDGRRARNVKQVIDAIEETLGG